MFSTIGAADVRLKAAGWAGAYAHALGGKVGGGGTAATLSRCLVWYGLWYAICVQLPRLALSSLLGMLYVLLLYHGFLLAGGRHALCAVASTTTCPEAVSLSSTAPAS